MIDRCYLKINTHEHIQIYTENKSDMKENKTIHYKYLISFYLILYPQFSNAVHILKFIIVQVSSILNFLCPGQILTRVTASVILKETLSFISKMILDRVPHCQNKQINK